MEKILKTIVEIDQVRAAWFINRQGFHAEFDTIIGRDPDLEIKSESYIGRIIKELPDDYQTIGCIFERNYIICHHYNDNWIIVWANKGKPLSYLRMELDVILNEKLYQKKRGFFSKIRNKIIKSR